MHFRAAVAAASSAGLGESQHTLRHDLRGRQPWLSDGWTDHEFGVLARAVKMKSCTQDEVLMLPDERGEWLAIVLSGSLVVEKEVNSANSTIAVLGPGDVVGEMAALHPASERCATVRTRTPCRLATLSMDELTDLLRDEPALGARLLSTLCRVAATRQLENAQRDRSALVSRNVEWATEVASPSTDDSGLMELHEAYRARLATHLVRQLASAPESAGRLDDAELTRLVDCAQFQPFKQGQRLVAEGEQLGGVMLLLLGSANLERWNVEVAEGGVLGAHEYFGVGALSAASSVVARSDGVLAGWPDQHLTLLLESDGRLAFKLLQCFGRYAMRLGATVSQCEGCALSCRQSFCVCSNRLFHHDGA